LDDRCIENFEENLEENNKKKYILIKKKFQKTQKISTFFDYFYSISRENPKKYLLNLINTYKQSLKMIKELENVKLINLNFHPSTLIFKDELIVLSNFERVYYFPSMNEERKSNLFSKYNKKDIFLPIEAHVICYLLEKNLESVSFGNIEEICADYYGRLCSLSCLKKDIIEGKHIVIMSDSVYAIRCVTTYGEKCDKTGWKDIPNKELVQIAYELYKDKPNIQFQYIAAHTNGTDIHSIGNDYADKLANKAIGVESFSNNKIYLNVPFSKKEEIKQLGGRWDASKKKWFIHDTNKQKDYILTIFTPPKFNFLRALPRTFIT
jgi:ribonuclease HI